MKLKKWTAIGILIFSKLKTHLSRLCENERVLLNRKLIENGSLKSSNSFMNENDSYKISFLANLLNQENKIIILTNFTPHKNGLEPNLKLIKQKRKCFNFLNTALSNCRKGTIISIRPCKIENNCCF